MGKLVALVGMSGTGKTSIEQVLWTLGLKQTISYTTRKPRNGEIDGLDYHFVSKDTFNYMIKSGDIIEYSERYDNLYGTGINSIDLSTGDYVCTVDPKGYESLKNYYGEENIILIYIYTDDHERLIRLLNRDKDVESSIKRFYDDNITFEYIKNHSLFKVPNIDVKTSALTIKNMILSQVKLKEDQ